MTEANAINPRPITDHQGIIDFYDAFSACDFDTISAMMHPECTLEFPGTFHPNLVRGRDAVIELLKTMQQGLNGTLKFHTKWAMFDHDMAAIHWYTTANPAHGGAYMNRGVAWFKLKDGLVYEFLDFLDTEVINAFWPNGLATNDFQQAERLVGNLLTYAPNDVVDYFNQRVQVK